MRDDACEVVWDDVSGSGKKPSCPAHVNNPSARKTDVSCLCHKVKLRKGGVNKEAPGVKIFDSWLFF